MAKQYMMTLTASNRVGILAAVSNAIAELGGDVQEVSVTVMRNVFTIILSADFPEHRESSVIVDHIHDIGRPYGLEVCLKDAETVEEREEETNLGSRHFLRINGDDQPGMMRKVAARLAQDGIDIADLYAKRQDDDRFDMALEIIIPDGTSTDGLINSLTAIDSEISASIENPSDFLNSHPPYSLRATSLGLDHDLS